MSQQPIAASRALTMRRRIWIFGIVMAVLATTAIVRSLWVQGIDATGAAAQAADNMTMSRRIEATRGSITDRNGVVLAEDYAVVRLIADPWNIQTNGIVGRELSADEKAEAAMAPLAISKILLKYLGGSLNDYLYHLTRTTFDDGEPNQYELIASNVALYTYQQIKAEMNAGCNDNVVGGCYYGVGMEATPKRSYPGGMIASNVVGFTLADENGNRNGAAGVEQFFDTRLSGVDGTETYLSSNYGVIPFADSTLIPAQNGMDVQLTIDSELQYAIQQELQAAVLRSGAQQGWAIAMNVKTAEVLALANYPTYDPNDFGSFPQGDLGNRAVDWTYEPGSVAKVLTMAALLDQGLIDNDTQVVVPSSLPSGADVITDFSSHGTLYMTARGVLANSSNIGTTLLARLSSKEALHDYWTRFGLGSPTGIELTGEGTGTLGLLPAADMEDYDRDRAAFGQSLSVTGVQMAAALAAAVNGGVYHAPTVVAGISDTNGNAIDYQRAAARRVISPEASAAVRDMMEAQAMATYSASEAMPGYRWLGKSGTAERVNPDTGLYEAFTSSYVGVAPAEDPTILVYIVLDNTYSYGSAAVRPAVVNTLRYALPRYGFAPASEVAPYEGAQYYR
ncbi:MAG: penicillin-binding protein 2 [Propionibacteriaceae bacterium]|nr:penicillin-binding protein 2 [Propionibacteriaceae bacterium]